MATLTPTRAGAFAGVLLFALLARPAAGQVEPGVQLPGPLAADSTLVDRVAAVVGDSVILVTEVLEEISLAAQQGRQMRPDDMLVELINRQLVIQAAARDTTLEISEDELDARVESAIENVRAQFRSAAAFQQALAAQGLSTQAYRDQLRERIRSQQIQQLFMARSLQSAPTMAITEEELREFYEKERGQLETRPELLTLEQVFIQPGATEDAWAEAEATADSLLAEIRAGADFAEIAEAHSDDPGSAAEGGDLGWFRRGRMIPEFERKAFALRDGQISEPVKTDVGYHIIKKERSRPGEVRARHILITPELSDDDTRSAEERAREVLRRAREGESMLVLYEEFGDTVLPAEAVMSRPEIQENPLPGYSDNLDAVQEGELIGPFETRIRGLRVYAVVRVKEIREEGEFTFEDLREQIREALQEQKAVQRILDRLRSETYIDIRM